MGGKGQESTIKSRQSGFTLVEIAVVLVVLGLLLGGIVKGQELMNNARVKRLAGDFFEVPMYVYGYHDKYKALPGDQPQAMLDSQFGAGLASAASDAGKLGNGVIDDAWNAGPGSESNTFWQHVRLAGLGAGSASGMSNFTYRNVEGGLVGVQSGSIPPITNLHGTFVVCSSQIPGRHAKRLDRLFDDGAPNTGSLMVTAVLETGDFSIPQAAVASVRDIDDAAKYTVCQSF